MRQELSRFFTSGSSSSFLHAFRTQHSDRASGKARSWGYGSEVGKERQWSGFGVSGRASYREYFLKTRACNRR
ncbi:hypothetical protein TRIP_B110130 [uncultured Desulfatiglans sp.]|uniref:Uncharacterized protein n=1 Tax=Uncultured Desulfatiglans sp. TaxID=1748965 RepID=A0A653A0L0_UNCDX|nr:hypothetical protein TRIP_B110130 [uncultured Desulfatiglans sp.]